LTFRQSFTSMIRESIPVKFLHEPLRDTVSLRKAFSTDALAFSGSSICSLSYF
jgi:hypothetical protein